MKKRVDEVIFDAEHFFDGFQRQSRLRAGMPRSGRSEARRRLARACATPTAARCRTRSRGDRAGAAEVDHRRRSASTATTTASWRWPTRWPPCEHGARPGAGHDQRLRRALRQRQPDLDDPEPAAQDGQEMRDARRNSQSSARCRSFVYELANIKPNKRQPYVGDSAFAHKGGMHVSGGAEEPRDLRAHRSGAGRQPRSECWSPISRAGATSLAKARSTASISRHAGDAVKNILRRAQGAGRRRATSSRPPRRLSSC